MSRGLDLASLIADVLESLGFAREPFSDRWSAFHRSGDGVVAYACEFTETTPEGYAVTLAAQAPGATLERAVRTLEAELALPKPFTPWRYRR